EQTASSPPPSSKALRRTGQPSSPSMCLAPWESTRLMKSRQLLECGCPLPLWFFRGFRNPARVAPAKAAEDSRTPKAGAGFQAVDAFRHTLNTYPPEEERERISQTRSKCTKTNCGREADVGAGERWSVGALSAGSGVVQM